MGDGGVELYYMRNRWYEPRTGRFLSEDPIGLEGGINLYAFGAADPINRRDASGLGPCVETLVFDPNMPVGRRFHTVWVCDPIKVKGGTKKKPGDFVADGEDEAEGSGEEDGSDGGGSGPNRGRDVGKEAVKACRVAIVNTAIATFTTAAILATGAEVLWLSGRVAFATNYSLYAFNGVRLQAAGAAMRSAGQYARQRTAAATGAAVEAGVVGSAIPPVGGITFFPIPFVGIRDGARAVRNSCFNPGG